MFAAVSTASRAVDQASIGGGASGPIRSRNLFLPEMTGSAFDFGFKSAAGYKHVFSQTNDDDLQG